MGYALVGVEGAVHATGSNTANTPAYGQSPTASNLLTLRCIGNGGSTLPTTPAGWAIATDSLGNKAQHAAVNCSATIFEFVAAGSDPAPTIPAVSGVAWTCLLAEFSGGATLSPVDQASSNTGTTTSPVVATNPAADTAAGQLVLGAAVIQLSPANTSTTAVTFNNGATGASHANSGTSTTGHWGMAYGITTANSSPDTASLSWTNTSTHVAVVAASFKLSGPLSYSFSLSDSSVATESLVAGRSFARPVSDGSVAAETLTRTAALKRTIANASAASDTIARTVSVARTIANTSLAADTLIAGAGRTRLITDTTAASDHVSTGSIASLVRVAAVSGLYPSSGLYPQADIYPGFQGDSSLAADIASLSSANPRSVTDTSLAADVVSRALHTIRTVTDTSLAADTVARVTNLIRAVTNASLASDVANQGSALLRTAADQSIMVDGPSVAFSSGSHRGVLDFTTLEDVVTRLNHYGVTAADQSLAADVAAQHQGFGRTLSESSGAVEALLYVLGEARTATDTSSADDAATVIQTYARQVADQSLAADITSRANPFIRNVTDSSTLEDGAVGFGVYSLAGIDTSLATDSLIVVVYATHRGNIIVTAIPVGPSVDAQWNAIDTAPAVVTVGH